MQSTKIHGVVFFLAVQAFFLPAFWAQNPGQEVSFNQSWAERAFAYPSTRMAQDNRLLVQEDTPGSTYKNLSSAGGTMQLGEKLFTRGLGVSARTVLRVQLVKPLARFHAEIGVDGIQDARDASVKFRVQTGGREIFASEFMKASTGARTIDVPLNGASSFDLIAEAAPDSEGAGRGNWANARIVLEDGSQLWLDQLADQWEAETDLPFSFVLDGKPSREFLGQWKRSIQTEPIDEKKSRRTVTLQDPNTGLEVRAVAMIYRDTPGVDWTIYFTNHGTKDSPVLEKLNALDVTIAPGVGTVPILHRMHGSMTTIEDFQPYQDSLHPGQRIEFAPMWGKSSMDVAPFFNLEFGGGGVITAIGWSGRWNAAAERQKDGKLVLQAGLQALHLRLHPGESIRGPRILQIYWFGKDPYRSYNLFRNTMFAHVMPRVDGTLVTPPIVHLGTSMYEWNDATEKSVLSHVESIKGLGFEMFWLDAFWTKQGFPQGMGNYGFPIERAEPHDRFPAGLKPIGDAVHQDGMQFLVWFEPERVYKGSYIFDEHPDWVIQPEVVCTKCVIDTQRSYLYNLGIPEAREYMTRYLITVIKAYGMDSLRIDYNIGPKVYWEDLDKKDPDRVGMGEIRYVEGFYKMWDDIREVYPRLLIDNCASGGMRIDLETSARSLPLWRTDATIDPLAKLDFNQSALQNQVMTAGLSRYVPFSTSGQMGSTPYLFRSGFNAGIAFGEDVRSAAYPRDQLKQAIEEGKRIRKYFFGNFYPLTEVSGSAEAWSVLQYHRTAEQDGMILAFRRHLSGYESYAPALQEIDPAAKYEVRFYYDYVPAKTVEVTGAEMQHLKLEIHEEPGSLLVEYKKTER
jgi:alpha-galactosidase